MALKQEMTGLELKRITEDSHRMNVISKPLSSLDENTRCEFQADLHNNFSNADSRSLPYSNKKHADDNLVKTTIMWKPVGDNVKEEPNEVRSFGTEGVYEQSWKSFIATNLYKKATYREKENLESGSGGARSSLEFPNQCTINAGLPGSVGGKRLQEGVDVFSKRARKLEVKAVNEVSEATGRPDSSINGGKAVNGCTATSEKTYVHSHRRQPEFRPEGSLYFASDSRIPTSIMDSREGAQRLTASVQENMEETSYNLYPESTLSTKAHLLGRHQDQRDPRSSVFTQKAEVADPRLLNQLDSSLESTQILEENAFDVSRLCHMTAKTRGHFKAHNKGECSMRCELLTVPVFSDSKIRSPEKTQNCEKSSTQDNDHLVVLFSEQKNLKASAGRTIRQELLKLSGFCSQYSHKFLSWVTSLARGQNTRGFLRYLQRFFSSQPKGFANLNAHKIPEFSTKGDSLSSSKRLAKDKELKAVLTKINEVLVSMERTSLDSMQESNPKVISHDAFTAAGSLSHVDGRAFATMSA